MLNKRNKCSRLINSYFAASSKIDLSKKHRNSRKDGIDVISQISLS